MGTQRPPLPPFTRESAIEKVRLAEDGWNSRDPAKGKNDPRPSGDKRLVGILLVRIVIVTVPNS